MDKVFLLSLLIPVPCLILSGVLIQKLFKRLSKNYIPYILITIGILGSVGRGLDSLTSGIISVWISIGVYEFYKTTKTLLKIHLWRKQNGGKDIWKK
jgi:hypothetical protein